MNGVVTLSLGNFAFSTFYIWIKILFYIFFFIKARNLWKKKSNLSLIFSPWKLKTALLHMQIATVHKKINSLKMYKTKIYSWHLGLFASIKAKHCAIMINYLHAWIEHVYKWKKHDSGWMSGLCK